MNALQYYIIDSYIKAKEIASGDDQARGEAHAYEELNSLGEQR